MRTTIFLLFFSFNLSAQIINIENRKFYQDTTTFVFDFGSDVDFSKNTKSTLKLDNDISAQYKYDRFKFILYGNNEIKRVNSDYTDKACYINFRIRYKLNELFKLETFTQYQFDDDLNIKKRILYGAGYRYNVYEKMNNYIIFSNNMIYEIVNRDDFVRLGLNITGVVNFDKIELATTVYYQPNIIKLYDYKCYNENSIKYKINKYISFSLNFLLLYNSEPITKSKLNSEIGNKISISF